MVASFLALHGGFWYSRVICSHIQSCRKEDVSFSDIPTKESLYFSDSDWVYVQPLNQSLCPRPYNDLSSHLLWIWHGINSIHNAYELSRKQVVPKSTQHSRIPFKEKNYNGEERQIFTVMIFPLTSLRFMLPNMITINHGFEHLRWDKAKLRYKRCIGL